MTPIRIGILTPSSNTVLEPATARMLHDTPHITAHFARFRVTRIALAPEALAQFDPAPVLEAAQLLADAHPHVIAWSGTSASWLGFHTDRTLCAAITAATGVPATSSILGLEHALDRLGAHSLGLVTPYTPDVQARIVANYAATGRPVLAERHLNDPGNYSFAQYQPPQLATLIREVAAARPDAITTLCTNLRSTTLPAQLEPELGIPILDSIATCLWHTLLLAGANPAQIQGWGRLFTLT